MVHWCRGRAAPDCPRLKAKTCRSGRGPRDGGCRPRSDAHTARTAHPATGTPGHRHQPHRAPTPTAWLQPGAVGGCKPPTPADLLQQRRRAQPPWPQRPQI